MTEMQIDSFLAVAETLNFSRAAEQMDISQPTLSKHIKLLEENLGFPLLERTRSTVSLTPEGVLMYHTLKGVQDQVRLSISRSRSGIVGARKTVGIGIMRGLSVSRIPVLRDAITRYRRADRGNDVILMRGDVKDLWAMLKSGDADLLVMPDYVSFGDRILETVPLARSRAMLFSASKSAIRMENGELNLPESSLISVGPEGDADYYHYFSGVLEQAGLNPAACRQANSISGMLNSASCGLGAALFFDTACLRDDPLIACQEVPAKAVMIQAVYSLKSGNFLRFLGGLQLCVEEYYKEIFS